MAKFGFQANFDQLSVFFVSTNKGIKYKATSPSIHQLFGPSLSLSNWKLSRVETFWRFLGRSRNLYLRNPNSAVICEILIKITEKRLKFARKSENLAKISPARDSSSRKSFYPQILHQ